MSNSENDIQPDYIFRINKALKFIDSNLTLETVSKVALFSSFHFHRIFKAITNETLNSYITRIRIEKAASVLMRKKDVSISELSLQYGFTSNTSFTRAFKKFYGVPPTEFRKQSPSKFSKIRQVESKNGQENLVFEKYICNINNLKQWIEMNAKIEIKETPKLKLASITQIGVDGIELAFERLLKWAIPKGFMNHPEAKLVRVFHDSFKITAPNKVRMSIGLLTNELFKSEGDIILETIKKGKCIVACFEIAPNKFETSWNSLFIWINENGYKKAAQNPFEIYHNDFRTHPENKCIVDFYIPIE